VGTERDIWARKILLTPEPSNSVPLLVVHSFFQKRLPRIDYEELKILNGPIFRRAKYTAAPTSDNGTMDF